MSDETDAWLWQGFFGPMPAAIAAYNAIAIGSVVGVLVPASVGPMPVDTTGMMGMFAVQTRPDAPMTVPANLYEADPAMVGRLVGA